MGDPTNWDDLNGAQRKVVRETLLTAFDRSSLRMLVSDELSEDLDNIVAQGPFKQELFELIAHSQRNGSTAQLIAAAQKVSSHPKVRALSSLPLLSVDGDSKLDSGSLEKTVRTRSGFEDLALWTEKLTGIRHRVCRIEDAARAPNAQGTGFLVGADLVLTNYHVVKPYLDGLSRETLACRFDFAIDATGRNDGTLVPLAAEWCILHAPYSNADLAEDGGIPAAGELDFALLRLARRTGDDPQSGTTRGWIRVSTVPGRPATGDIVFICQHPDGDPIKLAVGSVLENHGTRVRYDANTMPGSSGSPCFNAALDLVAYHHLGDPKYAKLARWNQGVMVEPLLTYLAAQPEAPRFWQG